jgi:hypothetical protein
VILIAGSRASELRLLGRPRNIDRPKTRVLQQINAITATFLLKFLLLIVFFGAVKIPIRCLHNIKVELLFLLSAIGPINQRRYKKEVFRGESNHPRGDYVIKFVCERHAKCRSLALLTWRLRMTRSADVSMCVRLSFDAKFCTSLTGI